MQIPNNKIQSHLPPASDLAKALRKDMTVLCPDSIACERELLRLPPEQALALLKKYAVFLDRYNTYLKMPNYINTLPYNINAPHPNYGILLLAHRLSLLQLSLDFNHAKNNHDRKILLSDYLEKQIQLLANKEPLIGYVMTARMVERSLNMVYLLAKKIDLSFFIRDIDNSKYNLCYALKREMLITHTLSEKDRIRI